MTTTIDALLEQWQLTIDGEPVGSRALLLPVRTVDSRPAMLKVAPATDWHIGSVAALRFWGGAGVVDVMRAAPAKGAVLLERLTPVDWLAEPGELADFWPVLHHRAPAQLPRLDDVVAAQLARVHELGRKAPMPPQLVQQAGNLVSRLREDSPRPVALHGALTAEHVMNRRDGSVAIAPRGLAGDPNAEAAAWLCTRHAPGAVMQEDFFDYVDALLERGVDVDEKRVRDWTLVLAVLEGALTDDEERRSQLVAVARAIVSLQLA